MNFENCPTWFCNEQGIPFDFFYFITFVILLTPYLGLVFKFFDKQKFTAPTNHKYIFFSATLFGFYLYFAVLLLLFLDSTNSLLSFIGTVSFAGVMIVGYSLPFLIIGGITLFVFKFWKKKKS